MTRAIVVGSGPNGLAAAVTLAVAGLEVTVLEAQDMVGGGLRSVEATLPGLRHDLCAGFHPLGVDNAFSRHVDLAAEGLRWAWPEVQYAHPVDGRGAGGAAYRSLERTVVGLGPEGAAWRDWFGPVVADFDRVTEDFLRPVVHVPRHPVALTRFGLRALVPATTVARRLSAGVTGDGVAAALWSGVAAHAFAPLSRPLGSAIGTALGAAAHRPGWPVAIGGSASIADAMLRVLRRHGGRIETGVTVTSVDELDVGPGGVVLLDTAPGAAADLLGDRLPAAVARAYRAYRHGPAAFCVSYALAEPIPWRYEPARRAGTVHVGGSAAEVAAAEAGVWRGRMPERPFVLVGQQHVADPGRGTDTAVPVDLYAHVPAGYDGDATAAIEAQLERFAPGFGDRVLARHVRTPAGIRADDANHVGGDILTGATTPRQLLLRPRAARDPYATGVPGVYLCSAATPPGAGAHGLCGHHAARSALSWLR